MLNLRCKNPECFAVVNFGAVHASTQRFDEAAKLDSCLGSGTVAVIAIPLAFRRSAACAVEATNGPAVQSLTWTPTVKNPRLKKVFPRTETGPLLSSENFQEQKRASLSTRTQIHANNWFYSMTCPTPRPPLGRCRELPARSSLT
jgi:hypothetical protein